jgi:hypothetical protein
MTEGVFDLFTREQIGTAEVEVQDVIDLCNKAIQESDLYTKYTNNN